MAYVYLTDGIGCYAFPDSALQGGNQSSAKGLAEDGSNYLSIVNEITKDMKGYSARRQFNAVLKRLKPTLKAVDLVQPGNNAVSVAAEFNGKILNVNLSQESEGFRRLFACLLAAFIRCQQSRSLFSTNRRKEFIQRVCLFWPKNFRISPPKTKVRSF